MIKDGLNSLHDQLSLINYRISYSAFNFND